ncbi:SgcJ/EcaC family oxidoreductase [Lentzea sp. NPDC058450]|uniref:SgcJ/EcaC family oxidoreductase n=1 Tax=Lentzea sp. NPDC058450 TaxID=3346505 RepID=UPI00364BEFC6
MSKPLIATAAVVLLLAGTGVAQAIEPRRDAAGRPSATELFDRWNASLATGDPRRVANMYAADAVLLPTVAGHVHDTRAEIVEYFTGFLALKPRGTLVETKQRALGGKALVLSGLYDFAITRDGAPETVHARVTFVFEKRGHDWKIVEHHSSKKP